MSVNVNLSITVRGYDPRHAEAVKHAIQGVIEAEDLADDLPPLSEVEGERGRCLFTSSDPDSPLIISGADRWEPVVTRALRDAAGRADGGPCEVLLEIDDVDARREGGGRDDS